jgi:hypothetical protein
MCGLFIGNLVRISNTSFIAEMAIDQQGARLELVRNKIFSKQQRRSISWQGLQLIGIYFSADKKPLRKNAFIKIEKNGYVIETLSRGKDGFHPEDLAEIINGAKMTGIPVVLKAKDE